MKELLSDDALLVVQLVEFVSVSPIVVVVWPILQGNEETEPRLPYRPVSHDVSPQLRSRCPAPVFKLGWDVRDAESHGQFIGGPLGTCKRRELQGDGEV